MGPVGYMVMSLFFMVVGVAMFWDEPRLLFGVLCIVASGSTAIRARLRHEGVVHD